MAGLLSQEQKRRYDRDGIVFPIRVLTAPETLRFRQACENLEVQLGGKPRTVEVRQMHLHFPWAHSLVTHPRVLDAVEDVLGPNLLVWATELFIKHARDSKVSIRWHRDSTYMGFDPATTTTAWIALSNSNAANGCMCAAPGPQRRQPVPNERLGTQAPAGSDVVQVLLQAGEMSLHDADIPHGSSPNDSDELRMGFVVRYVTPKARAPAGRPPVILARGHDNQDHFHIVEPPHDASPDQALGAMKESAARHLDTMLQTIRRPGLS
jgi:non-haem Fe2+, alpha-ketoglutarate-dependent halogenase